MSDAIMAVSQEINPMVLAEMDIQVVTAKRYPRDVKRAIQRATNQATLDVETAQSCFYKLKRGSTIIEGPSVRIAEIIASCWGNLRVSARIVSIDAKYVTAQGVCIDLESNNAVSVEVKRRITDKRGKRYSDDMIQTTSNAACAIAFRNALFLVIPRAHVKQVERTAKKVALGTEKTIGERAKKAVETFRSIGVPLDKLLVKLEVTHVDQIGVEHLEYMLGLYNAIEDGDTSLDMEFNLNPNDISQVAQVKPSGKAATATAPLGKTAPAQTIEQQWNTLADAVIDQHGREVFDKTVETYESRFENNLNDFTDAQNKTMIAEIEKSLADAIPAQKELL